MSVRNVIVGFVFGMCALAAGFVAWWRWSIHPLLLPISFSFLILIRMSIREEHRRAEFMQRFWDRCCTGIRWRRRFPKSNAPQIREFLTIFIEAFAFDRKHRLCFAPDDKIMEIYRGLYPDGTISDTMELEFLASRLRKRYGIDAGTFWREDMTLGDLFIQTQIA